jgi:hypothetical protein
MGEILDADAGHDRAFAARACRGPKIKGKVAPVTTSLIVDFKMSALGH